MIMTNLYFIHGLNGFADEWQPFTNYFSEKGFSCHAIELKSGMNLRKTRFQDYTNKILTLVKKDDIVIGHSMGGLIVQKVAEQTTIKAGIGLCPSPPQGINMRSVSFLSQIRYIPFIIARIPFIPTFSFMQDHFLNDIPIDVAKKHYKLLQKQSSTVIYEVLKQKISVDEKKVNCPLFFIARTHDRIISPTIVQRIADKYHAPIKMIPGNHYIFPDARLISDEIYRFIKSLH